MKIPGIIAATRDYERWVAAQTPIVRPDLAEKHRLMCAGPFPFLRGTFYRWLQLWPEMCPELKKAPAVLAIGDLHIENFGTWRDVEGRLIWGVNDVDEACFLAYTNDLVRLATSVLLAIESEHLAVKPRLACAEILEGYRDSLSVGGEAFVLAERNGWLRQIALEQLAAPQKFWERLEGLPRVAPARVPARIKKLLESLLPQKKIPYHVVRRGAGMGSRGHQRFVALADWHGGKIAREAKALVPSAQAWLVGKRAEHLHCGEILARAVRVPDHFYEQQGPWIVRRLAPDCHKINLAQLPEERNEKRMLYCAGWETANLHLGSRAAVRPVLADLDHRPSKWLYTAASRMAEAVQRDWLEWRSSKTAKSGP